MELAEDVLDGNGQPMLRNGTVLGERDLRRFRMWGIMEIEVVGDADEDDAQPALLTPEQLAAVEPEAREVFRHAGTQHPVLARLYEECLRRLARAPSHVDA